MNAAQKTQTDCPVQIYLVISQTGTLPSRILKAVTGAEYNHISISLGPELTRMYSFGRRQLYNPIWGGFVVESIYTGTFKRFPKTRAVVLAIPVSRKVYDELLITLEGMAADRAAYDYDLLGLFLAGLHICFRRQRHYYCSAFVKELLLRYHVEGVGQLPDIVQPVHFLALPRGRRIFRGYLRDYPRAKVQAAEACSRL